MILIVRGHEVDDLLARQVNDHLLHETMVGIDSSPQRAKEGASIGDEVGMLRVHIPVPKAGNLLAVLAELELDAVSVEVDVEVTETEGKARPRGVGEGERETVHRPIKSADDNLPTSRPA